jgi:hypothetical protein
MEKEMEKDIFEDRAKYLEKKLKYVKQIIMKNCLFLL